MKMKQNNMQIWRYAAAWILVVILVCGCTFAFAEEETVGSFFQRIMDAPAAEEATTLEEQLAEALAENEALRAELAATQAQLAEAVTEKEAIAAELAAAQEEAASIQNAIVQLLNNAQSAAQEVGEFFGVTGNVQEAASGETAIMTHADYMAAELDSPVIVETYVQAKQSWWQDKATIYTQAEDGAYFIYELPISQEDYDALVPGTKIRVSGYKTEWSGEVEIVDATYEVLEAEPYIAEAVDVTALLGTDELAAHQNEKVAFKGMTVEAYNEAGDAFEYKNAADKTDDLYFKVSKDGQTYDFCVEFYLCGADTDVYKAVTELQVGDVIDLEGFLYWYNGANPHITAVTPAQ